MTSAWPAATILLANRNLLRGHLREHLAARDILCDAVVGGGFAASVFDALCGDGRCITQQATEAADYAVEFVAGVEEVVVARVVIPIERRQQRHGVGLVDQPENALGLLAIELAREGFVADFGTAE